MLRCAGGATIWISAFEGGKEVIDQDVSWSQIRSRSSNVEV
jgi:hypothetical protein